MGPFTTGQLIVIWIIKSWSLRVIKATYTVTRGCYKSYYDMATHGIATCYEEYYDVTTQND